MSLTSVGSLFSALGVFLTQHGPLSPRALDQKSEMQAEDPKMNRLLKGALSHPDRKEILDYLRGSAEETSTSALADALDLDGAKVSYHLKVLRDADLVMQAEEAQGHGERAYLATGPADR